MVDSQDRTATATLPRTPPPQRTPLLHMEEVRKIYDTGVVKVDALRGIDLEVYEGDYVAIMGPSGSGKSTLMHIIGCLDIATSGRYLLGGEEVGDMSERHLAQVRNRQVGFVFQQFNLLASMTAQRNVELPLMYAGVDRAERKRRATDALTRVGLANRLDHRPGELSGGQQQRVSVARALVTNPTLILADEPTGNLDSVSTRDVLHLLDELHDAGRTIVLITHESDVAAHARRVLRIDDGLLTEGAFGDANTEAAHTSAAAPRTEPTEADPPGAEPTDADSATGGVHGLG